MSYKTPGVYVKEVSIFPPSVAEVETAVPAFIGYTEKAEKKGEQLMNVPTKVTSLLEYTTYFGGGYEVSTVDVQVDEDNNYAVTEVSISTRFYMYDALRTFFDNGGGTCYIVSVGTYGGKDKVDVKKDALEGGLAPLLKEQEPTMVVIPDVVRLKDDSYDVYKQVLAHCAKMQSRVAILDIYDGYQDRIVGEADVDIITKFREKIGTEYLSYAAAYYPWLNTNIVQRGEITFKNLKDVSLDELLPEKAAKEFIKKFNDTPPPEIKDDMSDDEKENAAKLIQNNDRNFHLGLMATSPTYANLLDEIIAVMNILPPAAAMAGIYTTVDNNRGVWKSPANISLNSVVKPASNITHDEQENLNVDAISGKSINAIRTFPGIGPLVWGGRTLDGNSLDWRYINVRRTMIMLEQSIKLALRSYVFEPNDANTWITVKSMIVNFLIEKWKQGALAGSTPEDAFNVQVGLGSTMTSVDILEGKMLVTVKLAIVRPAEFIVVTFEQQMQKS